MLRKKNFGELCRYEFHASPPMYQPPQGAERILCEGEVPMYQLRYGGEGSAHLQRDVDSSLRLARCVNTGDSGEMY